MCQCSGERLPHSCQLPVEVRPQYPKIASDCPYAHLGPQWLDSRGGVRWRWRGGACFSESWMWPLVHLASPW